MLDLFLPDDQHRKLRGGPTQTHKHIFPFALQFSLIQSCSENTNLGEGREGKKKKCSGGSAGSAGGGVEGEERTEKRRSSSMEQRESPTESSRTLAPWKYDGGRRCFHRRWVSSSKRSEKSLWGKKRDGGGGFARVAAGGRRGTTEGPKSGSRSRKTDVMTHRLINRSTVSHRGFFF